MVDSNLATNVRQNLKITTSVTGVGQLKINGRLLVAKKIAHLDFAKQVNSINVLLHFKRPNIYSGLIVHLSIRPCAALRRMICHWPPVLRCSHFILMVSELCINLGKNRARDMMFVIIGYMMLQAVLGKRQHYI